MWPFQAHKVIHIRYIQSCNLPQKSKFKNSTKLFKLLEQLPRTGKKKPQKFERKCNPPFYAPSLKKLLEELKN